MKQRMSLNSISLFALITLTGIAAATSKVPGKSTLAETLRMNRHRLLVVSTSSIEMVRKMQYQPLRNLHVENQRLAFMTLTPHQPRTRTRTSDPIGTMVPRNNNQWQFASPKSTNKMTLSVAKSSTQLYHSSPQRNFLGNNNKNNRNDDNETSLFGRAKNIAKKFLPSTWFQSDEERRQLAERKQMKKEIQTGIQQIFKDAPLPIRMVSNMIGPIFGTMMTSLAETAASQQSMVDVVYDQAVRSIRNDPSIQEILGDAITVGRPFSQSSSSSSVNGVTSTRMELAFPVSGRLGNGVGRLSASGGSGNPMIDKLVVQVNGMVVDVNIGSASFNQRVESDSRNNRYGRESNSNIIDAEIIEKDTKK